MFRSIKNIKLLALLCILLPQIVHAGNTGDFTFFVYDAKEKKELRLLKAADFFPEKSQYHLLARPNGKVNKVVFKFDCSSEKKTVSSPPYSISPPPVMDMCTIYAFGVNSAGSTVLSDSIVLSTGKDVPAVDEADMDWRKNDIFYGYALKKDKLGNIQSEISAIPEDVMGEVAAKQIERRMISMGRMAAEFDSECKYAGNCSSYGPEPFIENDGSGSSKIAKQSESPVMDFKSGRFETVCNVSHYAYADPLRVSTSTGSNLNMFWGNTIPPIGVLALDDTLKPKSTCRGGIEDLSTYWAPAMLDAEGEIILPREIRVSYSVNYEKHNPKEVYAMPKGFAMSTGFPTAMFPMGLGLGSFKCDNKLSSGIPLCNSGQLEMQVSFLYCWNGVREDNKDQRIFLERAEKYEKDHVEQDCPFSHPYVLPQLNYSIIYDVNSAGTKGWRLSSDRYANTKAQGGYSVSGGFIDGWNIDTKETWMDECVRAGNVCTRGKLGNGMQLMP